MITILKIIKYLDKSYTNEFKNNFSEKIKSFWIYKKKNNNKIIGKVAYFFGNEFLFTQIVGENNNELFFISENSKELFIEIENINIENNKFKFFYENLFYDYDKGFKVVNNDEIVGDEVLSIDGKKRYRILDKENNKSIIRVETLSKDIKNIVLNLKYHVLIPYCVRNEL